MFLTADLFIDAILVLLNRQDHHARVIIQDLLSICREELKTGLSLNDEIIRFYIQLIQFILDSEVCYDDETGMNTLILKFQSNPVIMSHHDIWDSLTRLCKNKTRLSDERYEKILDDLRNNTLWYNSSKHIKQMFGKLANFTATTDKNKQGDLLKDIQNLSSQLTETFTAPSYNKSSVIERIDFGDIKNISTALDSFKTKKVKNIFRFGWQGLNRMFGKEGGYSCGDSVIFNALSHHYKSSMLMNIARWTIQHNYPTPEAGKNPTVLFISLENETSDNMMMMYRDAYIATHHKDPDTSNMSDQAIVEFVHQFFNAHGWKFILERRLGQDFGFEELKMLVEELEQAGYTVLCTIIDYMNMMKKTGDASNLGNHLMLRDLYTNVVNYLKHKGSALFSGHQLNRDAAKLAQSGITNVVDKFGIGFLADGMDPQREVDVTIYMHIEKNQFGVPYLTIRRDKRRYDTTTPETHKRCAYRFTQLGIPDDLNGPDMSVPDIYADTWKPDELPGEILKDIPENTEKQLSPSEVKTTVAVGAQVPEDDIFA